MSEKVEFAKSISIINIYNDFTGYRVTDANKPVLCPIHNDTNPSMKLYVDTNKAQCFGCDFFGGPIDLVMAINHWGQTHFMEAVDLICEKYNFTSSDSAKAVKDPEAYQKAKNFHDNMKLVAKGFSMNLPKEDNYFLQRGLSEEVIVKYCLGFSPEDLQFKRSVDLTDYIKIGLCNSGGSSNYRGRYIFPMFDRYGFVTAFAGRSLKEAESKYINGKDCEYFHKSELLYNYHIAKNYDSIIVVEGYMDALSLITAGYNNTVAIMGVSLTSQQMELLKNKEIILSLDNDSPGLKSMNKIITLNPTQKFKVITNYGYKDFNEALIAEGVEGLRRIVTNHTCTGIDFVIQYYAQNNDVTNYDIQDEFWGLLASLIGAREQEFKEMYPINLNYTPVAFNRYWKIFDTIIGGDE